MSKPCVTGKKWRKSTFIDFHEIDDDVPNWRHAHIERCHLCECNTRNGTCVNPQHVYIGTSKENSADRPQEYLIESGRRLGLMETTDDTKRKMSESAKLRTDRKELAKKLNKPLSLVRKSDGAIFHFESQREAAKVLGINPGNLSGVVNGARKSIQGFTLLTNR